MNDQTTLLGFESPEYKEVIFLESILPQLKSAVVAHGGPEELLSYKSTALDMKSNGYTAVFFFNFTVFRLRFRGKQHYISLPTVFSDLVPEDFPTKQLSSDPKYLRLLIDAEHPIEFYADFLIQIAGATVDRYPKEWDCCSRYMACSDAKTCVHPDKAFALSCGYRKILNSGRIFYGKNRNID